MNNMKKYGMILQFRFGLTILTALCTIYSSCPFNASRAEGKGGLKLVKPLLIWIASHFFVHRVIQLCHKVAE